MLWLALKCLSINFFFTFYAKKSYLELFEFRAFFFDFRHDCIILTCMYILTNHRFR